MAKSKNNPTISKNLVIVALLLSALLVLGGYYFGYDVGFEKATKNSTINSTVSETTSDETDIGNSSRNIKTITPVNKMANSDLPYEIPLPNGWVKTKEIVEQSGKTVRYEDAQGNFLDVVINPPGAGFGADEVWWYEPVENQTKLKVTYQQKCDNPQSGWCAKGDKKYTIGIKSSDKSEEAYYIRNNHYFFLAGNDKREENVNTKIYKDLVESIIFK